MPEIPTMNTSQFEEISYPEFEYLHRRAQMSTTLKADDILVRMAWMGEPDPVKQRGEIAIEILDVSLIPAEHKRLSRFISAQEAAAIAALFIAADGQLESEAYAAIGLLFQGVPNNLRPIP